MTLLLLLDADDPTGFVVSFPTVCPRARFDGVKWTKVAVEEGACRNGPWTTLVTTDLNPLDDDPAAPAERDITLRGAQLESGWYRITFSDEIGLRSPVRPIYNGVSWAPSPDDVAVLMTSRLVDEDGGPVPSFTDQTNPTVRQVRKVIDNVQREVLDRLTEPIPDRYLDSARSLVAIGVVGYLEEGARPEGDTDSLGSTSRAIFLARLKDFIKLVGGVSSGTGSARVASILGNCDDTPTVWWRW